MLDELWDFGDPAASERRFVEAQEREPDESRQAELLTQEARAVGLQGRFDEAIDLLESVEILSPAVEARVLLEQGRVLNSSGRPADAVPLFEEASVKASAAGLEFLAVDALHMIAIADRAQSEARTAQALAVVAASSDLRTQRWEISLRNNRGWTLHEDGRYDAALEEFESAYRASLAVGTSEQQLVARWAIARCLRSLGRYQEALALQEELAIEDPDDPFVAEELGALRAALGLPEGQSG
jgi:tetratricopeptide (TPR) repeat protein